MATEIEHKFLLANDGWRELIYQSSVYQQGYLNSDENSSVRVRISGNKSWLNIKSATIGNQRAEYEYEIPVNDATEILENLCQRPFIEKTRHLVKIAQHIWEIDEFKGDNQGLIVAEIELNQSNEFFEKPYWLGQEVTEDLRYYNNQLCKNPFSNW